MKISVVLIFLIFLVNIPAYSKTEWLPLAPGLAYAALSPNPLNIDQHVHAFRISLMHYQLGLIPASALSHSSAHVQQFAENTRALLAINAGFFSPQLKPLGLRISKGVKLNALKNTSWWKIFLIKNNQAFLMDKPLAKFSDIAFAIESGPRLIHQGRSALLSSDKKTARSALGITQKGEIIIAITENLTLTLNEMANVMQKSENENGLACIEALNLDGGTSSQLYAKVGDFNLAIPSLWSVADAIIVKQK